MKIVYGAATGTIEEANQRFVYDVPDEVDADDLDKWLVDHLLVGISVTGLILLRKEVLG